MNNLNDVQVSCSVKPLLDLNWTNNVLLYYKINVPLQQ